MTAVVIDPQPVADRPPWSEMVRSAVGNPKWWAVAIVLLGFFLRVWQLDSVPPGFRDDELIETLVISQNILDGDLRLYYPDASGHEFLYHALNALFLAWFGPGAYGIRLLSALLGVITLPLTYVTGRKLFGPGVALAATAVLAVSFWGLMYSRFGIRHILTPPLMLGALYFFWRGLGAKIYSHKDTKNTKGEGNRTRITQNERVSADRIGRRKKISASICVNLRMSPLLPFIASGVFMGVGFYSYFASRGVPLIIVAFAVYLALFAWSLFRRSWKGIAVTLGMAMLVALPLAWTLAQQPEAEGRVGELAMPLNEALVGNFDPMTDHFIAALATAHSGGDPEWLYNIPERPLFGPVSAIFFWAGVLLAGWYTLRLPIYTVRSWFSKEERVDLPPGSGLSLAAAFLLIWWLVGIAPAFVSVPPASLGHMIVAQPAIYLLAALPVGVLSNAWAGWSSGKSLPRWRVYAAGLAALVLVVSMAARDLPDYFVEWPQRGMVRFLYRADIEDVAGFIQHDPARTWPVDFGITGLLAGPWDREALDLALEYNPAIRPRWYNPERVLLLQPDLSFSGYPELTSPFADSFQGLPKSESLAGGYELSQVILPAEGVDANLAVMEEPACFVNGLCLRRATYESDGGLLELTWRVGEELNLPPLPLISNPPPPGVYAGPRLYVFAHLIDAEGNLLAGDDGLWVDPATLHPGDVFLQQHRLHTNDPGSAAVLFGLYDPLTGERIPTSSGADHLQLDLGGRE